MTKANPYIIEGGAEGKKRLNVLAGVLEDDTRRLLEMDGEIAGKSFLDVGCGGGNVSIMAAGMVGEHGSVTGVDFDAEIVKLAAADAQDAGLSNISFEVKSADDINYQNAFDIAYSRFLLSHLTEPGKVLQNMMNAVRPGGRVIVEDIDFSGHYCFPASESFNNYVTFFSQAAKNNGQDANIGLSLFDMLKRAGLSSVSYNVIQPSFHTGAGKWMAYLTMDKIKDTVISQGLANEQEVTGLLSELKAFTTDPDTIISLPRIFRVWGYKTAAV